MDPIERLNSLSEEVTQTFHSDFVFLIDAEIMYIYIIRSIFYFSFKKRENTQIFLL